MIDRYYQTECHEATIDFLLNKKGNGLIVMAGGAGKTVSIAKVIKQAVGEWKANTMVITHNKELVTQNWKTGCKYWPEGRRYMGVNSESLKCRDYNKKAIFATIQSVYRDAISFPKLNLLIIDEVHRVQLGEDSGMFQQFIRDLLKINPKMRILGYSAQDGRHDSGSFVGYTRHHVINEKIYEIGNAELVAKKYLSPLINKASSLSARPDVSGVPVGSNGEFIEDALEDVVISPELVVAQVDGIFECIGDRKTALGFCVTVKHSELVINELKKRGHDAVTVNYKTLHEDRDKYFAQFDSGEVRFFVNVGVAKEGYDNTNIDFIFDLAPTNSQWEYMQKDCRGSRVQKAMCKCGTESTDLLLCSNCGEEVERFKKNCYIFDPAGNINRHGSIDELESNYSIIPDKKKTFKFCPKCKEEISSHLRTCPFCKHVFEGQEIERRSSGKDTTSIPILSEPVWMDVIKIQVSKSTKNPKSHIVANFYCENGVKLFQNIQLNNPTNEENWSTRIDYKITSGTEYCRLKLDRYTTKPKRVQVLSEKGNYKIIGVE